MNSLFNRLKSVVTRGGKKKSMLLSIVILVEVLSLLVVATFAWVETVSSIKITNEANTNGTIDTYVFTEADIGGTSGTIDIAKYFKQAGDMHLAPASSADGTTMYFPKANLSSGFIYRKGNVSDKNTAYLSVSFKVRTDTNADFFFEQVPTFSALGSDIRVSVTSQSEGSTSAPVTNIYSSSASTTAVVNSTSGGTGATTVKAYSAHIKGTGTTNRLFAVGANETKIITINIWLQKKPGSNTDLTTKMSQAVTITNFGITSSLTPHHVTLLPTPEWDRSGETQYFYAWCWDASNGDGDRLYKLELDENEHYSFDYNGTYRKTLFIRAKRNDLTTANMANQWNTTYIHNKTEDTTIPNDPVDPTYIIETINGGSYDSDTGGNKSTGSWHDPAIIKIAHTTDQTDTWGTMAATTYVGSTTSTHIIEQTNSSSSKHKDTVHAWPGKTIKLEATAASANYAFVGWYDNEAGTGTAVSTANPYTTTAPSTASEITYYAKFKEVRTLTIYRYVDGSSTSTAAAGTITIGGTTSANNVTSYSKKVDKGSSVAFSATAATGYTLSGIYTTASGSTTATTPVTLNDNTSYYARFTANSYNVKAHACYTSDTGTTYTTDDSTGGTVKAGSSSAGATSTASVKYKSTVNLVASAASGYYFVGWYSASSGGTELSTNTTYTYTLSTTGDKDVYARFKHRNRLYLKTNLNNWGTTAEMTPDSNGVYTYTASNVPEGGIAEFKIHNTTTDTWFGGATTGTNYTETCSNVGLSSPGENIQLKAHAGSYTFTFNSNNNQLTITRNSYNYITITFNTSSTTWVADANAIVWFDSAQGSAQMTKNSSSNWTVSVPSNYATGISFKRNDPNNTTTWNKWENKPDRGYKTTYKTSGDGTGDWQ